MIKRLPEPKEAAIQRNLFRWAQIVARDYPELELLNASMNGAWLPGKGKQKFGTLTRLKQAGCIRVGYPDVFLPVPRGNYYGLFIELKRRNGKVSKYQQWWIEQLNGQGYFATVARGFEQAQEMILRYLKGEL